MKINTIVMDKVNTISGTHNGVNFIQTVPTKDLLNTLRAADTSGAVFQFNVYSFLTESQLSRDIKKYTKRANEVANALGLTLSEMEHPVINGHTITGKWQFRVIG